MTTTVWMACHMRETGSWAGGWISQTRRAKDAAVAGAAGRVRMGAAEGVVEASPEMPAAVLAGEAEAQAQAQA